MEAYVPPKSAFSEDSTHDLNRLQSAYISLSL
jgi:hypothetical protein